jgi:hypothetical protein
MSLNIVEITTMRVFYVATARNTPLPQEIDGKAGFRCADATLNSRVLTN